MNTNNETETEQKQPVVNITLQLEGEEAEMFNAVKDSKNLKRNAEATRTVFIPALKAEYARIIGNQETQAAA